MSKALLLSIAFVPIFIGLGAASARRARAGLARLVAGVLAFDALYALSLYYLYLRLR